jgi:hypothetical protein
MDEAFVCLREAPFHSIPFSVSPLRPAAPLFLFTLRRCKAGESRALDLPEVL